MIGQFNSTEQSEILEIARVGLAMVFTEIAEELDLDEDHLKALQEKIEKVSNSEENVISCYNCNHYALCYRRLALDKSEITATTNRHASMYEALGQNCVSYEAFKATCQKCGSPLTETNEFCTDVTCPYSDIKQDETYTYTED